MNDVPQYIKDINRKMAEVEANQRADFLALKAKSKNLSELVVKEGFSVQEVVCSSYPTSHGPDNPIIGGRNPVYKTGYTTKVVLKVKPHRDIPVKTLNFNGFSAVRVGDRIKAAIPKYGIVREPGIFDEDADRFYVDREYNLEEKAIEIITLFNSGEEVARIDRAVDYFSFT